MIKYKIHRKPRRTLAEIENEVQIACEKRSAEEAIEKQQGEIVSAGKCPDCGAGIQTNPKVKGGLWECEARRATVACRWFMFVKTERLK